MLRITSLAALCAMLATLVAAPAEAGHGPLVLNKSNTYPPVMTTGGSTPVPKHGPVYLDPKLMHKGNGKDTGVGGGGATAAGPKARGPAQPELSCQFVNTGHGVMVIWTNAGAPIPAGSWIHATIEGADYVFLDNYLPNGLKGGATNTTQPMDVDFDMFAGRACVATITA